jgi:hypothetical protein
MKKMYGVITTLKSKSGFVWDNEKGMDVTQERRPEWDDLVKVCTRISSVNDV